MSEIWITPDLTTPGTYSYNAHISDGTLKVWLHLRDQGRGRYMIECSTEKCGRVRGPLGSRQLAQARALRAELEPLFLAAIIAAGWTDSTDVIFNRTRWTRA